MARARLDPRIVDHLEWVGYIRPTGLVVSAPALVRAGAILDRRDAEGQRLLREQVQQREFNPKVGLEPWLPDFQLFARAVLGWSFSPKGYAGTPDNPIPDTLEVTLSDFDETLRPDFAVREMEPGDGRPEWQVLVKLLRPGQEFDRIEPGSGQLEASPHARMERLLRRTAVPAGLLFNGRTVRLMSAPHGENSGWLDFRVADMVQMAGRPICAAMRLLLGEARLLALPRSQRLAALLEDSRKFQNEVSERLAEQVLHALYELLRGFQAAHDATKGDLLRDQLTQHPDEVYRGLLTVILRLVFLLYAEERDMMPEDEAWVRHYSLAGLYERLREDAALFPDTMDLRYGAWTQLLVLFRMIHDGAETEGMKLPRRHGVLFNPDRFPFLEGRTGISARQVHERVEVPQVPDGTVYRALEKLLVLEGERISYRALDVEQIGSVYETMMGFRLETVAGRSVAIRSAKRLGAPTTVDLEVLLAQPSSRRMKVLEDRADRKFTSKIGKGIISAMTLEELHSALLPLIDFAASPDVVPKGAMVLQPSQERRRSGSHYTPRTLTEPVVRATLEPILAALVGPQGEYPKAERILDLKVCDPAMGSGAFLVEACRQLGDALVEAWRVHDATPKIPRDENEIVFARRLVAQRCLYGVDRNPVAVDLAKMSLWLVTLAKDHALTFVDHALRHGDSLVGLSRNQLEAFHWDASKPAVLKGLGIGDALDSVSQLRRRIREASEEVSDWELRDLWDKAQFELSKVRFLGDLVLAAWFEGATPKDREARRQDYVGAAMTDRAERYRQPLEEWRYAADSLAPFHWELEFPEVFERSQSGFDAIVGNPPFLGGKRISGTLGKQYKAWLAHLHELSSGNADLVAHFFRRAFSLLRPGGTLGLVATNTISQGDTRRTGLRWIGLNEGTIYRAWRRHRWPGPAAVIVSVVWIVRGPYRGQPLLGSKPAEQITAFLFHRGGHDDPQSLKANAGLSFIGCDLKGQGFLFDDHDPDASDLDTMRGLLLSRPELSARILPYIGGEELNEHPQHQPSRYVIDLSDLELSDRASWDELFDIAESRVKVERLSMSDDVAHWPFWRWWRPRLEMRRRTSSLERMLVIGQISNTGAFTFVPSHYICSHKVVVFAIDSASGFAVLQSRVHDVWARFFSASFGDALSYAPSDCFETFPFPTNWEQHSDCDVAGKACYTFRAALMLKRGEGLTATYNRFNDPGEKDHDIHKLRELHAAVDCAVLTAYGWQDIQAECEFVLDYEIDEDGWGDKKRPYRYRWPDDVRDEVLARLLELNSERAKEEARLGGGARPSRGSSQRGESRGKDLFS